MYTLGLRRSGGLVYKAPYCSMRDVRLDHPFYFSEPGYQVAYTAENKDCSL